MLQATAVPNPMGRRFLSAQLILRILAFASTLASICIMVTSGQEFIVYGLSFAARYYFSSAFKFLLVANGVVCAFSLLSSILVYVFGRRGSTPRNYFFLFLHDMVMMILMISGCAATTGVGFVGLYGITQTNWFPVCDHVAKFCSKIATSVAFSYLAFFFFLALTIMSAYKLRPLNQ